VGKGGEATVMKADFHSLRGLNLEKIDQAKVPVNI
jgi:hypothetical protein